jgi:hypothetical protein
MNKTISRPCFTLLFMAALAAGCGGARAPVPATKLASAPRPTSGASVTAPLPSDARDFMPPVDCDDLLSNAAPLLAVEREVTEEQMARVLNIANAVEACPPDHPPKSDDLRVVLVQARSVLADWYSEHPEERAAALGGDTATLDGYNKPVMDARRWAEAYLRIEEGLARVLAPLTVITEIEPIGMRDRKVQGSCSRSAPNLPLDGRRLDDLLGWCAVPHVLLRVDAMAGALSSLLSQAPSPKQEDILKERLGAFRDAMLAEAAFWVGAPTFKAQRVAVFPGSSGKQVLLAKRLARVAQSFKVLSLRWGDRPIRALRNDLGNTLRSYVAHLEAHGIDVAKIGWPARVDDGVNKTTGTTLRTRTVTLRRLHEEILFDQVNLQALFEIRDAEDGWATLLDQSNEEAPAAGKVDEKETTDIVEGRMQEVHAAAQLLLRGFRHTETRQARLAAASRLVMTVDLDDGSQVMLAPRATRATATTGAVVGRESALRSYTSRVLAELALCLLNEALLDLPAGHGCNYPIMPPPATGWGTACSASPLAAPFLPGHGASPPIPERVRDAYDRVIATLANTWLATGVPPEETPTAKSTSTSAATVCELSFFTSVDTMARLGVGLRAYRRLVSLIAARRLPIEPKRSGPVLAAGLKLAEQRMISLCDTYNPDQCSAKGLARLAGAPTTKIRTTAKSSPTGASVAGAAAQILDEYCITAEIGAGLYTEATSRSPGNGMSLLTIVEPYLANLAWREILALGNGFIRANKECTTPSMDVLRAKQK